MPKTLKTKTLKRGGKVGWSTSGGETHGTVQEKVAGAIQVKGHTAKAAKQEPQFMVKSGKAAVRKPDDLKKRPRIRGGILRDFME